MGGKGSGYRLPLMMTKEMKMALDKLVVKLETADDFPVALRVFRAGLIVYGVLSEEALQAMYIRKKIRDDEAMFLIEERLTEDFRPVKVEILLQADELSLLNKQFKQVISFWDNTMKESAKIYWLQQARKYPGLQNAKRLLMLVKEVTK